MVLKGSKAQAALEYSVLISVVIAAIVAMPIYMKHSYEGKLRSSIDEVGKQSDTNQLEIVLKKSTTGESVERSIDGDTTVYTGYDEDGCTSGCPDGPVGQEMVTDLVQNSYEHVDAW